MIKRPGAGLRAVNPDPKPGRRTRRTRTPRALPRPGDQVRSGQVRSGQGDRARDVLQYRDGACMCNWVLPAPPVYTPGPPRPLLIIPVTVQRAGPGNERPRTSRVTVLPLPNLRLCASLCPRGLRVSESVSGVRGLAPK